MTRIPFLTTAMLLLGLTLGACTSTPVPATNNAKSLSIVRDAMDRVHSSYVEPVDNDRLLKAALKGMLGGLDPHSDYMDEKEYKDLLMQTRGKFTGIGAELTKEDNRIKVISPIDETPAALAGVRAGDIIAKIDGQPTDEMNLGDVVDKLRGPAGTQVTLTLERESENPRDVVLTRAVIQVVSVKAQLRPGRIGYARITTFNENTQDELMKGLARIERESGRPLKGFVLDLRNDPGGLLEAAIDVASDFLEGGVVVSTRGREEDDNQVFGVSAQERLKGVPMVVLINGASASASEIVAGALQDRGRATILGTPSFGKGSVQSILPLDGGHGALRLTTALYYTPSGRSIQGEGISPDEFVPSPKDPRTALARAVHEADLRNAFTNADAKKNLKGKTTSTGAPAAAPAPPPAAKDEAKDIPIETLAIGTEKDTQLAVAVKRLEEMANRAQQQPAPVQGAAGAGQRG